MTLQKDKGISSVIESLQSQQRFSDAQVVASFAAGSTGVSINFVIPSSTVLLTSSPSMATLLMNTSSMMPLKEGLPIVSENFDQLTQRGN